MPRASLALLAILVAANTACAVVLCARPKADGTYNTSIKLRDVCKSNETRLDPVALGLQGPQGTPGGLILRDAGGQTVGVVDMFDPTSVTMRVGGQFYGHLRVDLVDGITGGGAGALVHYATIDCSGEPHIKSAIDASHPPIRFDATVFGSLLMFAEEVGVLTHISSSEAWFGFAGVGCSDAGGTFPGPHGGCCLPNNAGDILAPIAGTFNLATFVPPFHLDGP